MALNKHRVGLTLGVTCAIVHLIWVIIIGLGYGQRALDWVMGVHFIATPTMVGHFRIITAIGLVVAAFVGGYIIGWLFSTVWNYDLTKQLCRK
jgi:hypothetical protein